MGHDAVRPDQDNERVDADLFVPNIAVREDVLRHLCLENTPRFALGPEPPWHVRRGGLGAGS